MGALPYCGYEGYAECVEDPPQPVRGNCVDDEEPDEERCPLDPLDRDDWVGGTYEGLGAS